MKKLSLFLLTLLLFVSFAYAVEAEPPSVNLPIGISDTTEFPPVPDGELPTDTDIAMLLEEILSRLDFFIFTFLPLAIAVLVVFLFCWWFYHTFVPSDYLQ